MSEFITVVIKYEEGQDQPSFHANMEALGGKVTSIMFDDALLLLEKVDEELEALKTDKELLLKDLKRIVELAKLGAAPLSKYSSALTLSEELISRMESTTDYSPSHE
jgi:hypothetical protein